MLEEIQIRAEKHIFLEETEKAIANSGRQQFDKKVGGQDEYPRKGIHSRAGKYNKYTPLTYPSLNCSGKLVRSKGFLSQKFSK